MARLTTPSSASLRMPTLADLPVGTLQRHLVLLERDDEELQRHAGDLLLLDADDAADAVGRIDDPLVGLEAVPLADRLLAGGGSCGGGLLLAGGRLLARQHRLLRRGLGRRERSGGHGLAELPGHGGRHLGVAADARADGSIWRDRLIDATGWPHGLGGDGRLAPPAGLAWRHWLGLVRCRLLRRRLGDRDRTLAATAWPHPWREHWPAAPCAAQPWPKTARAGSRLWRPHASSRQPSLPRSCCWSLSVPCRSSHSDLRLHFILIRTLARIHRQQRGALKRGLPGPRSSSSSISAAFLAMMHSSTARPSRRRCMAWLPKLRSDPSVPMPRSIVAQG